MMPPNRDLRLSDAAKRLLGKALLAGWAAVALVGLGSLSFGHMVAMPRPGDPDRLGRALSALRRDPSGNLVVHVIYAGCSCTERLFAHLMERRRFADAEEIVLFAGADRSKQRAAQRAGFGFFAIAPGDLVERYGLDAAPVLAVFDRAGRLRYLGGYYAHPSALAPLDESLHADVAAGRSPDPLPVFGCAVNERLQRAIDPLGIAY